MARPLSSYRDPTRRAIRRLGTPTGGLGYQSALDAVKYMRPEDAETAERLLRERQSTQD